MLRFSLMFISIFVVIQLRGSPSLPTVALHDLLTWMCSATREDLNLQIINVGQSALIGSSRESLQRPTKASSSWKTRGWEVLMMFFCYSTPPSLISREEGPRRSKLLNVDDGEAASLRLLDFLERSNSLRRRCFSRYQCQKGSGSGLTSRKPEAEYWAQSLSMPLIRGERDMKESSVDDSGCSGTNTAEQGVMKANGKRWGRSFKSVVEDLDCIDSCGWAQGDGWACIDHWMGLWVIQNKTKKKLQFTRSYNYVR